MKGGIEVSSSNKYHIYKEVFIMSLPKLTTKSMTILTSILLIAGQILNAIYPHHLFHVNQIMLLTMLLLEIHDHQTNHSGHQKTQRKYNRIAGTPCFYSQSRKTFSP